MKILLLGVGAAGNKAAMRAIERRVVPAEDVILVNSTSRDIPKEYEGSTIILSDNDFGCGKEVSIGAEYAKKAIKQGKLNIKDINTYTAVILCASVEGGTGSGATPILARFFSEHMQRNTHVIAFTGFEEDVRGLQNTISFFKAMTDKTVIQTIQNSSFLKLCGNNKFKAEQMANDEMCDRIEILSGKNFIASTQNIDAMDIRKIINTHGYMTVEHITFEKPLVDQQDFNRVMKEMIYASHSIKSLGPGVAIFAVILNVNPASDDAIDFTYKILEESYGKPFESFTQKQWDGKQEYIALIISGMLMPIDGLEETYQRYKEASELVNKNADQFFAAMDDMKLEESNSKFDRILPAQEKPVGSIDDFLSSL